MRSEKSKSTADTVRPVERQSEHAVNYNRYILPVCFIVLLIVTNPDRAELLKQLTTTSKSKLWALSQYLGLTVRNMLTGTQVYNIGVASFVKASSDSYYVGIAGFWIEPGYWISFPGWFVIIQVLWSGVKNLSHVRYYWVEFALSIIGFIFMSKQIDSKFQSEKAVFVFYSIVSIFVYGITHLGLYPTRVFNTIQPGSMLYGVASTILMLMMASQRSSFAVGTTLRWLGRDIPCAQVCLVVVLMQLMLGHTMGFAGTLTGLMLYHLLSSEVLGKNLW